MPPPRKSPPASACSRNGAAWICRRWKRAKAVRARAVGDVLPRVLTDLRLDDRRAEAEVVKVWNSLIDPNIVAHAQPANLRKGTLFVNVDSSVWLSEIVRYRRKEILDRLAAQLREERDPENFVPRRVRILLVAADVSRL